MTARASTSVGRAARHPAATGLDPRSADLAERHAAPPREERQHDDCADRLDDERREGSGPDLTDGEQQHDRGGQIDAARPDCATASIPAARARTGTGREPRSSREQRRRPQKREWGDACVEARAEPRCEDPGRKDDEREAQERPRRTSPADACRRKRALAIVFAASLELALQRQEHGSVPLCDTRGQAEQARRDAVEGDLLGAEDRPRSGSRRRSRRPCRRCDRGRRTARSRAVPHAARATQVHGRAGARELAADVEEGNSEPDQRRDERDRGEHGERAVAVQDDDQEQRRRRGSTTTRRDVEDVEALGALEQAAEEPERRLVCPGSATAITAAT